MKLAVQENLVDGSSPQEKVERLEKYGYDGMEVWGRDVAQRMGELKAALSTSRVKVSTICAGYEGDLLGADRATREKAMQGVRERLRTAAELGAVGLITVPTFGVPKIPDLAPWMPDVQEVEQRILVEECRLLGRYAEDVGAYLILEPLNRYETHFMRRLEQAVAVCKEVGLEHVKVMADFFHMNIEEPSIASSLDAALDYVVHIHLADSNRVLPGYGHTDFAVPFRVLKGRGYKHFMALECHVPGPPGVELPKCARHLRGLM